MTTVYRVQRPNGYGPYWLYNLWLGYGEGDAVWIHGHNDDTHPSPRDDGLNVFLGAMEWKCGFRDLDQLSDWFTDEELVTLYSHGFAIYEIEAERIQVGKRQILYIPKPGAIPRQAV